MIDWFELFNNYRVAAQHLVSFLLAGLIWRWGGAPEKWLIGTFVALMVVPIYPIRWWGLSGASLDTVLAVLDVIAAIVFVAVALQANRNYPLWVAGLQVVSLSAHLANAMVEKVSPLAVAILVIGPSYCQLLVMIGGFVRHVLRERRFGRYRAWRVQLAGARGMPL